MGGQREIEMGDEGEAGNAKGINVTTWVGCKWCFAQVRVFVKKSYRLSIVRSCCLDVFWWHVDCCVVVFWQSVDCWFSSLVLLLRSVEAMRRLLSVVGRGKVFVKCYRSEEWIVGCD